MEASGDHSQGERLLYGRDPRGWGGTGKAEAAKCVLCIPATGLRAWEFSRSGVQAKRGGKGKNVPRQFIRLRCGPSNPQHGVGRRSLPLRSASWLNVGLGWHWSEGITW